MRAELVRRVQLILLGVILVGIVVTVVTAWQAASAGEGPVWLVKMAGPPQTLSRRHIGIVAGHSGNDSGAVCPDGLTEASVNLAIAQEVVRGLQRLGAQVDLLQEFDPRLHGYQGDAFLSIHADSCQVDLTGYKVASLEGGSDASQRLVQCLWDRYEQATGMARHPDTITYDMRGYHAFREINPDTPAAIIETGFLKSDRLLLTTERERPTIGIIAGIECFLSTGPAATPTPAH